MQKGRRRAWCHEIRALTATTTCNDVWPLVPRAMPGRWMDGWMNGWMERRRVWCGDEMLHMSGSPRRPETRTRDGGLLVRAREGEGTHKSARYGRCVGPVAPVPSAQCRRGGGCIACQSVASPARADSIRGLEIDLLCQLKCVQDEAAEQRMSGQAVGRARGPSKIPDPGQGGLGWYACSRALPDTH